MESRVSLLLPLVSVALLAAFSMGPELTGFAVAGGDGEKAMISVSTAEGVILPPQTNISVASGGCSGSLKLEEFISMTEEYFEIADGFQEELDYRGPGYTGNHTYKLPITAFFNLPCRKYGEISVEVSYNGTLISESRG